METIALGIGSVLASCLFAWLLSIIAEKEVRHEFAGLSKTPYWYDGQRSFTPLEFYASRLLAQRSWESKPDRSAEPSLIFVRPTWVTAGGALVDLMFSAGVILVLVGSVRVSDGLWGFLLLWYIATGTWLFIKDVLGEGTIGDLGYHLRFVLTAVLWPFLLTLRSPGWMRLCERFSRS